MNAVYVAELEQSAIELADREYPTATNEGTFGVAECCRKVGTGEPRYGNYTVYTRVGDGRERVVGCDPERAPGRRRQLSTGLAADRKRLAELRREIARQRKACRA